MFNGASNAYIKKIVKEVHIRAKCREKLISIESCLLFTRNYEYARCKANEVV